MQKIKRILATCDYPPITGGQSAYFKNLWAALDPYENLLLLPCRSVFTGPKRGVKFLWFPRGESWFPRIIRLKLLFFYLLWYCLVLHPSELHVGQLVAGGVAAFILRRIIRVPYVLYIFGSDILEFTRSDWQRRVVRAILNGSKNIITISQFTRDTIQSVGGSAPVTIIAPGVEHRFFISDPDKVKRLRKNLPIDTATVLLTVGRLVKRKGHDVVIRALPEVLAAVPDIRYLIVGDGPYRDELFHLADELGVLNAITWCGKIEDDMLPAYYGLADIFIMVSRFLIKDGDAEGYGIVYLEANAAGVPVIAGKSGGVVDAVNEGVSGVLVDDPSSPALVAAAIKQMAIDKNLRASFAPGCLAWAQQAVWDKRREQWAEMFKS